MRRLAGTIALAIFIFSCSQKQELRKTNETSIKGSELAIEWGVVTNDYGSGSKYLANLTIINNSKINLPSEGWTLYFNYNPCRVVELDSLPDAFKMKHINGDFYKISPTDKFKGLNAGASITIPVIASAWSTKETDTPGGFYFTFGGSKITPVSSPYTLLPYERKEQIDKTKADNNLIPTAISRFENNQRFSELDKATLSKITPTPVLTSTGNKKVVVNETFTINFSDDLKEEANFLAKSLKQNLGVTLPVIESAEKGKKKISISLGSVQINGKNKVTGDEAYTLDIDQGIRIVATDSDGAFWAIQSLRALFPVETLLSSSKEISLTEIHIEDAPSLTYRGMHLDVSRNFQSKESVMKLLDLMSFYKLNKFHFHLVDDEGWRIAIEELPELTQIGSKRGHTTDEKTNLIPSYGSGPNGSLTTGSGFYSRQDMVEILKYATERHIEVLPELDMPGHARAAIKSMNARYQTYKQKGEDIKAEEFLLIDSQDSSQYSSVQQFNDNVVCVCQESTYKFIETVLDDIIEMYEEAQAPLRTVHTGGDEVPHGVWENSPVCESFKNNNTDINNVHDIKDYFLTRFNQILASRGLATAGWEEIAMHIDMVDGKENKTINNEFVDKDFLPFVWNSVYGWGGEELGYKLANAGYKVVLSNVTNLYFDLARDKAPNEPGFYWGGFLPTEQVFKFQPFNVYSSLNLDLNGNTIESSVFDSKTKLTKETMQNIHGIQGQLWTETVISSERMDYMIFPRMLCLAERAWNASPQWAGDKEAYEITYNKFVNRLGQIELPRMDNLSNGVLYRIPSPGAIIKDGNLMANIEFPGLEIRYTTDGSEPSMTSNLYEGPVKLEGKATLKAFSQSGRSSKPVTAVK
jgi:hexosaminidase